MKRISVMFFMLLFIVSGVNSTSQHELIQYKFEEGSGSIILDTSSNSNYATRNGGRWRADAAAFGDLGFNFDGNNDYIETITNSQIPENLTISQWIVMDTGEYDLVWTIHDTTDLIEVFIDQDSGDNLMLGYFDTTQTYRTLVLDTNNFNRGQFYHLVINIDNSNNQVNYYRDTVKTTIPMQYPLNRQSTTNLLRLGTDDNNNNDFKGDMDEFRVFDFNINQSQVNSLHTDNTIDLYTEQTEPESQQNLSSIQNVNNIINSSTPLNNVVTGSKNVKFNVLLNTPAICEIYIDNVLEGTTDEVLGFEVTKDNMEIGNHTYFLYCSYIQDDIKYQQIQEPINFQVSQGSHAVEFYLYDRQENLLLGENLYLATPCFDSTSEYATPDEPHYIKKIINGIAQFNLSYTNDYNFCIYRGNINYNNDIDNYQIDINFPDVKNEIDLGNIVIGENTLTYAFKMDNQDLYKVIEPEHWGKTWEVLFNLVIGVILGGGLMLIGVSINNDKLIMVGGLVVAIGMGFSLTAFVGAVL